MKWLQHGYQQKLVMILIMILLCLQQFQIYSISLILVCKVISTECGLLKKIRLDAGGDFASEKFKEFCRNPSIEQAESSLYHHQSNGQLVVCTKFIKWTLKNAIY